MVTTPWKVRKHIETNHEAYYFFFADDLDMQAMDDDALADRNIFSDPESDWNARRSCSASDSDGDQPESDRRGPYIELA